jgi:uncharacterized membrane protein YjdF
LHARRIVNSIYAAFSPSTTSSRKLYNRAMKFLLIGSLFSGAYIAIAAFATKSTYKVAPIFLIPLLWGLYFLRGRIHLHLFHFLLFAIALLLHDLGAFELYQKNVFGLPYDNYVHFYFGLVGALIIHRALLHHAAVPRWQVAGMTILFVMGTGAIHEIYEYGSYLVLGEESGMLKPRTSSWFDTHRDLTANFLGCLVAYLGLSVHALASGRALPHGGRGFAPVMPPSATAQTPPESPLEARRSPQTL